MKQGGRWELKSTKYKAPTVKLASGQVRFSLETWHHLKLNFKGSGIQASIDGAVVASVSDATRRSGVAGIGTGWNKARFDNFAVE